MVKPLLPEAIAEWRAHWKLVLASAIGASMMSIALGSLGAFMAPLEHEFGWKRAQISAGLTLFAALGVLLNPLLGAMIDRWGPRRFGVPGVILCGAAFALFGTVTNSIVHWLALWVVFSVIAQIPRPLIWSAAVSSEFKAGRGLAIAMILVGGGLGTLIAAILAVHLIDISGWRAAYAFMGLGWGGVAGVVCYLFFYSRSDRLRTSGGQTTRVTAISDGVSAREALRSSKFAKLAVATLCTNSLMLGLLIHMIPLLSGTGLSRADATWVAGLVGFAGMVGQLTAGALADRVRGNLLSAACVVLLAVPCALLLIPSSSVPFRLVAVVLEGLVGGAQTQMLPYLTTRYFGLRAFGTIFGFMSSIMAIAVGLGPLVAGYVYDRTQSYDAVLMAGIPMAITAALLILSLGRYPDDHAIAKPTAESPGQDTQTTDGLARI